MAEEIGRHIDYKAERVLWGRAAARCEFDDCNRLLYLSPVTQEAVNLAEMAHIYSFSKAGPRGRGPYENDAAGLNDLPNLMLVCHDCHKKIDQDKTGAKYSAELLQQWKEAHEARVRDVTGISKNKRSHVVLYGARIGEERSPLQASEAMGAMFPDWYPTDDRPVNLSMQSSLDDANADFWIVESAHVKKEFDRHIRTRIDEGKPNQFSVFALAPQPLLILLGSLFTDKVPVEVYQRHREPTTWKWQPSPDTFAFKVIPPSQTTGRPVLRLALSADIVDGRIQAALPGELSIWTVTIENPDNDFLRSKTQLEQFRVAIRSIITQINTAHPDAKDIAVFPAMPVACAIELGRCRTPKADRPWVIYDQNHQHQKFISTISIGHP